jgi:hypothetical protein
MPPHSTACCCIGLKNLETVKIRADLFNFESLLRFIFLRYHCGNVYINVHISHDLGAVCGGVVDERWHSLASHDSRNR